MAPSRSTTIAALLLRLAAWRAAATRVPSAATVGANALVMAADSCSPDLVFRLFDSRAFSPDSLVQQGSNGETPLMAALRAGCGEVVALVMLHPAFDDSAVTCRQMRRLTDYAQRYGRGIDAKVHWALEVMAGVRTGKVSKDELCWNPRLAVTDGAWFLPEPGDWRPPMSLEEMGIPSRTVPAIPNDYLRTSARDGYMYSNDGAKVDVEVLIKLWYLVVAYIQAPSGSEQELAIRGHIRSIGWALFFWGGKDALLSQARFVERLSTGPIGVHPTSEDEADDLADDELEMYEGMGDLLPAMWNKTGDWVLGNFNVGRARGSAGGSFPRSLLSP